MKEKLRSSKGMTLTELIVALAVVSLIGISLTVGVSSAVKVYQDSTQLFEAETLCGTILTYLEDEFRFGRNIDSKKISEEKNEVVFDSQAFGKGVRVIVKDGKILIGKDEDTGFDLLSDAAYTSGLRVVKDECEITYDKKERQVKITIAVGPDDSKAYVTHTVTVVPVDD